MICLEKSAIELIKKLFNAKLEGSYKLYLFGSRAKDKNRACSDIDLAIDCNGKALSALIKSQLKFELEHSNLDYKVDLVDLNNTSEDFKKAIEGDLVQVV